MPKRFTLWGADLRMPFMPNPAEADANSDFVFLMGRLKPGLTPKSAAPDLNIIAHRLAKQYQVFYPSSLMFACRC